jgi:hypothetical protein
VPSKSRTSTAAMPLILGRYDVAEKEKNRLSRAGSSLGWAFAVGQRTGAT